jgi:hypothetical protein
VRIPFLIAVLSAGALSLSAVPAAAADTTLSSNWAGYAVHRSGVKFQKVSAAWQQPSAKCTRGDRTYSAIWVGLGGYSETSQALEQIGTEIDCTSQGKATSSAWFELVPAASRPIHVGLKPGDHLTASVVVTGHTVRVALHDLTTKRQFVKTLHPSVVDISSAEWILEAPSDCTSANSCQTLPLANFGSAGFSQARVQSTRGHVGAVSDSSWNTTRVLLRPGSREFVNNSAYAGAATPSALRVGGSAFSISYSTVSSSPSSSVATRAATTIDGYRVVSGRA